VIFSKALLAEADAVTNTVLNIMNNRYGDNKFGDFANTCSSPYAYIITIPLKFLYILISKI
jgi:hypothetical protein